MELSKLILLACLMLIPTQQVGATSVLAVRKKVGNGYCVWIGADTASVETKDGNKSVHSNPKIIKLAPLTYFVAAGYFTYQSKKYSIKFNAYLSAKEAYQRHKNLKATAQELSILMVPLLRTLLVAFKQDHPAAFQDISIKKSVLECLLVGVEQRVPMMYPVTFKAIPKSDGTVEIVSTVTPISPNENTMTALGHSELIVDAVRRDPACFDRSLTPAKVINELLMLECNAHPAEVRPPISLLELSPDDCFWLQGPYEKE